MTITTGSVPAALEGGRMVERKKRTPKAGFHPGGTPGKLHRELGVPVGKKIPAKRLAAAEHSRNPEIKRDAIRAKTMMAWHH